MAWRSCKTVNYNYYVSGNGSDSSGDGSLASPWASIQTAQQNIQKLIQTLNKDSFTGNITINIDGSNKNSSFNSYHGPLIFGVQDSFTYFKSNQNYVIYSGINSPNIQSAHKITSQWIKVSSITNHLDLYQTNIKSQVNLLKNVHGNIYELYMNHHRINMSSSSMIYYHALDRGPCNLMTNISQIPNIKDIINTNYSLNLMVKLYEHWTSSYSRVRHIVYTEETGKINLTLNACPDGGVNDKEAGWRYYLLNNIELLNYNKIENQFYFNETTFDLYLILNTNIDPNQNNIMFSNSFEIISIIGETDTEKVENLIFTDLNLEYAAINLVDCFNETHSGNCRNQSASFLYNATIHTINVNNIIFNNINISKVGGYAAWFDQSSTNIEFTKSFITDIGAGGIRIGPNIRDYVSVNLLAINVSITNNYITNGGNFWDSGCGILAQQLSYSNITHNEIAYFHYTGISTGWTWDYFQTSVSNLYVSHNYIHNIGENVLSDMGCIYTLGEQSNSIYSNNICHDVWSFSYGGWGIYFDASTRYVSAVNNIVYNTKSAGQFQHFGLDNIMLNNIYAYTALSEHYHDGSLRSGQHTGVCNGSDNEYGACSSFTFITNIIYVNDTFGYDIFGDPEDTYFKNMSFDGNTYWSINQKTDITFPDNYTIKKWVNEGKDVQYAIGDPMFVDPQNYNFELQLGSPAIALGFHPIDTNNVGPDW